MSKEKVPMKIVVPIIVVTWILSLISSLAIVYVVPSLVPVKSEQIGKGSITSDKIANNAIITVKLADGTITSVKISDGTITAVDLADGSVIEVKIADGNVTANKIADGNVTANKIADGNVTTNKIADGNVTTDKIADGAITSEKLDVPLDAQPVRVIAAGFIMSDGTISVGYNIQSVTWTGSRYEISITGVDYFWSTYITIVQPTGTSARMVTTGSIGDKLTIYIYDAAGINVQDEFQFVTYAIV